MEIAPKHLDMSIVPASYMPRDPSNELKILQVAMLPVKFPAKLHFYSYSLSLCIRNSSIVIGISFYSFNLIAFTPSAAIILSRYL